MHLGYYLKTKTKTTTKERNNLEIQIAQGCFHMLVHGWRLSSHGKKIWIEVTLLWVRSELIALYMILKISWIEEGALYVTFLVFVIRCESHLLCFSISFSLTSKNFHFFYTPPTSTPPAVSLLSPEKKSSTIWTQ